MKLPMARGLSIIPHPNYKFEKCEDRVITTSVTVWLAPIGYSNSDGSRIVCQQHWYTKRLISSAISGT